MKPKAFICWFLISIYVVLMLFPFPSDYYKSNDLQYITLRNAKIELYHDYRQWWVIIDDIYYCSIRNYPEQYENICDMIETGEITIGVVRSFRVHFINFNNNDYKVISIYSPKIQSLTTIESCNKVIKQNRLIEIPLLCLYFILSFLYWYFLSDGKLINKWRKYRKKQKKLNYKKRHKKKQQKAKKT